MTMKKVFGRLVLAAVFATTVAGIASAQGVVPMYCSTAYGNGPVVYRPDFMIGRSCWLPSAYGRIYGVFLGW